MNSESDITAELVITPQGTLRFEEGGSVEELVPKEIAALFEENPALGLLRLGIRDWNPPLSSSLLFWHSFARKIVTVFCTTISPLESVRPDLPLPKDSELLELLSSIPFMKGAEYVTIEVLQDLWRNIQQALYRELDDFSGNSQQYLQQYNSKWNLVGRVCFHLAENKNNEQRPFAFLATYITSLASGQAPIHLPLKRATADYVDGKNHAALLALLTPVHKAAEQSSFVKKMVDSGSIFQPQTWSAHEAYQFLKDLPLLEQSGILIRIPNWWSPQKPPRAKVAVKVGENQLSTLGLNSLLDFQIECSLSNGERLTFEEMQQLLDAPDSLIKVKGNWIELDKNRLHAVLSYWNKALHASKQGISMQEALRFLSGISLHEQTQENCSAADVASWSDVHAGKWLKETLENLRQPTDALKIESILKEKFQGTLRPYQIAGVQWLYVLYQLKIGGCLADDMGLGKTIQIIALLLLIQTSAPSGGKKPHLLVVPASLLGSWQTEIARFAPSLTAHIAHSSILDQSNVAEFSRELKESDLVITTYGFLLRSTWLQAIEYDLIILDEAQAIKNPYAKQTQSIKAMKGSVRLTLTGTPIENRIIDLWSLFDFTSSGLLGSKDMFASCAKKARDTTQFVASVRTLVQPYILRRLKTDASIISDLPSKTEMQTFCLLTKTQVQLYQKAISELALQLQGTDGIQRQGLVLSYLLRFKQICNHPTQWLGYGEYSEELSGKFIRLREICEEIAEKQEKVLVFTQFREIIPGISAHLEKIFGKQGLSLHGQTSVSDRKRLVTQFQKEQGPPFFVLSLKAGGTGLTLTEASHVIHFDRWWNPAVENQATDRAYRIGQQKPVLVHKFICSGTIEEKIDALISSKQQLSKEVLENGNEIILTKLSDEELLKIVSLDITKAMC